MVTEANMRNFYFDPVSSHSNLRLMSLMKRGAHDVWGQLTSASCVDIQLCLHSSLEVALPSDYEKEKLGLFFHSDRTGIFMFEFHLILITFQHVAFWHERDCLFSYPKFFFIFSIKHMNTLSPSMWTSRGQRVLCLFTSYEKESKGICGLNQLKWLASGFLLILTDLRLAPLTSFQAGDQIQDCTIQAHSTTELQALTKEVLLFTGMGSRSMPCLSLFLRGLVKKM